MFTKLLCLPAYNKFYESEAEVLANWAQGEDFKIYNGPYFSIRDIKLLSQEYREIHVIWDLTNQKSTKLYPSH